MPFNLKFDKTPNSSKRALCDTCRYSTILHGSNGERVVNCSYLGAPLSYVRMKVVECSRFIDNKSQTLDEMKDSAWLLGTKKIVGLSGGRPEDEVQLTWSKPSDRKEENRDYPSPPSGI